MMLSMQQCLGPRTAARASSGRRPCPPADRRRSAAAARAAAAPAAAAPPAAAAAAAAAAAPAVVVRPFAGESELLAVARMRAEAYHEEDSSRFAATFKKQFAEREAASLRQRTASGACECLVAVKAAAARAGAAADGDDASSSSSGGGSGSSSSSGGGGSSPAEVLGCIDLRPPNSSSAAAAAAAAAAAGGGSGSGSGGGGNGPPAEDAAHGAYLLNVVVSERARGRGVGEALMRAALRRARERHGARRAYTHVEAGNGPAARLYARCGFCEGGEERGALAGAAQLGRVLLLRADLEEEEEVVVDV
jgi:ribosomal protein S18 acetylase RimI-like enzyme